MALKPGALDGDRWKDFHPGYWSIAPLVGVPTGLEEPAEDLWHFNPRLAVRDGDLAMVRLWFMAGGREGLRHLPQAGGLLDQAQIMMDAFDVIGAAVGAYGPRETETETWEGEPDSPPDGWQS